MCRDTMTAGVGPFPSGFLRGLSRCNGEKDGLVSMLGGVREAKSRGLQLWERFETMQMAFDF